MTQKALLQSAGDGTAVPQGYVGEVLTFNGSVDPGPNSSEPATWPVVISTQTIQAGNFILIVETRGGAIGTLGNATFMEFRLKINGVEQRRFRVNVTSMGVGINCSGGTFFEPITSNGSKTFAVEGYILQTNSSGTRMSAIATLQRV